MRLARSLASPPDFSAGLFGRSPHGKLVAIACVLLFTGCSRDRRPLGSDASSYAHGEAESTATPAGSAHTAATTSAVAVDVVSSATPGSTRDAGPPVVTAGVVDGKALRERHRARLSSDTSPVTILQGGTPRELGARLCESVVPSRPKDTPILIKPNIGGFEWFKDPAKHDGDDGVRGRTTDPEFVRGIIQCLKARGHTRVTIAEGWGSTHAFWKKLVQVSGYERMAREENIPLVAMDDDGLFDVEGDQPGKPLRISGIEQTSVPTLLLPKILAEHLERGMFISAPKIKAHRFGVVSIGIKGMQGTVMRSDASPAFHQKWRMHGELQPALTLLKTDPEAGRKAYLDALHLFSDRMVDVLEISAPDVILAEGAPAMGGDGFARRWPSAEDIAVGGTNTVLVDRVGAAVLGLWDNADLARELGGHPTSPLIEAAAKRFSLDIASPKVQGNGKELLDRPRPVHFVSMSGFALHSDDTPPEVAPGRARGATRPGADGDTDAGNPSPAREARAIHVESGMVIDGQVDDAWKAAPITSFSTDWSGAETGIRTHVRFARSKRALYTLWELEGAGVNVDTSKPVEVERAKLYEEDCVELFLGPDASERTRYFELEVGPLGHFLDIAIDRARKKSDVAWSSNAKIATQVDRDAHKVTIEIELRAPEIVSVLRPGSSLPLGLYRMEGKSPRKYLAWSPTRTPKPNFHVPEAFGVLKID